MKYKPTNGFNRMADTELELKAQFIITSMTGNAYFPNPVPTLEALAITLTNYSNALTAAQTGNRTDIADKNAKKDILALMLQQEANYVAFAAMGNRTALISSGFTITQDRQPAKPTGKPEGLSVEEGQNPGELSVSFKRPEASVGYLYEFTPDPLTADSFWESENSTTCKMVLQGLESGKKYWVRIAALGTGSQLVYSDTVSHIVQ